MMRVVQSTIVCSFLLGAALLAETFPFSGSGMETNSINQEPNDRDVARRIVDKHEHEKVRTSDLKAAESAGDQWSSPDIEKNDLRIHRRFANQDDFAAYQFRRDADLEKRAIGKQKFKYYRCYFNPVTCYRK